MAEAEGIAAAGQAAGTIGSTVAVNLLDKLFPDPQKVALSKAQTAQVIQETANDKAKVDIADRGEKDSAQQAKDELAEKSKEDDESNALKGKDQEEDNQREDEKQAFSEKIAQEEEDRKEKEADREDAQEDKKTAKADAKVCLAFSALDWIENNLMCCIGRQG
jgi:hydroxylamine reductase (hybrid-cluster protein)